MRKFHVRFRSFYSITFLLLQMSQFFFLSLWKRIIFKAHGFQIYPFPLAFSTTLVFMVKRCERKGDTDKLCPSLIGKWNSANGESEPKGLAEKH